MSAPFSQHHHHHQQLYQHKEQSTEGYVCLCQSAKNSASYERYHSATEHVHSTREASSSASASAWTTVLCSHCVRCVLRDAHERRSQAVQRHDTVQRECARTFDTSVIKGNLSQLQFELEQAGNRLAFLRTECATAAIDVATAAVQNEERRAKIPAVALAANTAPPIAATVTLRQRQQLERLQAAIQDEAMMTSIKDAQSQVRRLRWQWALQAFAMHRLDVEEPVCSSETSKKTTSTTRTRTTAAGSATTTTTTKMAATSSNNKSRKQARGIGKIGGLPLPHAGPELYGVLPPNELQSALRLTSSVTASVARCLGIILPHPILLQAGETPVRDIVEMVQQQQQQQQSPNGNTRDAYSMDKGDSSLPRQQQQQQQQHQQPLSESTAAFLSSSTASLASLMGQTAKKAIARATGQQLLEETVAQVAIPTSMEPAIVQQRLHHAVAAVLAEANTNANNTTTTSAAVGVNTLTPTTRYALSAAAAASEEFAIALQLLQNNIVVLCIRAGVPVTALWPAEAVLLNLHALQVYCREQLTTSEND
jgi:hypothetical protein